MNGSSCSAGSAHFLRRPCENRPAGSIRDIKSRKGLTAVRMAVILHIEQEDKGFGCCSAEGRTAEIGYFLYKYGDD